MTGKKLAIAGGVAVVIGVLVWWLVPTGHKPARPERAPEGRESKGATSEPLPLWHTAPDRGNDDRKADPAGTIRLEGQVIDEAQNPVAGATVVITTNPTRLAISEGDGSFGFDGLLARTYRVAAYKDDARAEGLEIRVREDTEPVILRMHRGMSLVVTVLDADGDVPIAGATVSTGNLLEQEAITGTDGKATLIGMGSWFNYIEIEADGYAQLGDGFKLPDDPGGHHERTVHLVRGAPVSGVVLTPDGKGQAGAWVNAESTAGQQSGGGGHAQADDQGRWTIAAVAPGEWVFTSPGLEFAPGRSEPITLDGKAAKDGVEIHLVAGARIAGVVVDSAGAPVPNAVVVFGSGYGGSDVSAGADGQFEILGLPRASYSVAAREGDRASPLSRVDVRTADVSDVRLAIADATISGVVVDTQGEPVAEAQVDAMPDGEYTAMDGSTRAVTDSHGRWTLGPLSSESYRLRADWPDTDRDNMYTKRDAATAKPGDRDVKIVLPAAGTIRGVVMRGGAPVTRYAIAVGEKRVSPFNTPKIVAHADGRFERSGLPPGTYELAVAGADFALTTVKDIEVKAGEVKDIGTVSVGDGRTVRGTVVDASGAPVAGATVACALYFMARDGGIGLDDDPMKRAMMNQRAATSGADGSFTVLALAMDQAPKHPPKCLADKPGVGRSAQTPLPEDAATPITLTLQGTGAIIVTVENIDGDDGVSIEATPVGGEMGAHAFGGKTGVRLEGLVPGMYKVRASQMGAGMRSTPPVTVEVRSGETTPATVTFARGAITLVVEGTCQFAMLLPPGDGAADWDAMVAGARCEQDGSTEIADVAPGDYRLCATQDCIPVTVTASPARQTVRLP